jgi:DNA-binding XRE family transcriptional regulator
MCSTGEIQAEEYIDSEGCGTADICVRLGKKVRALRKQRQWRQDDLAQHSGFTRTYISNLERGKKNPSLRSLEVLAVTFKTTIGQLLDECTHRWTK